MSNTTSQTASQPTSASAKSRKIVAEFKASKEFLDALRMIETGGESVKKGLQIAIRKSIEEVLSSASCNALNMLQRKLDSLESPYYAKLLKKNFACYCGYVVVEQDSKGKTRYYYCKDGAKSIAPVFYSKEKGKKGWNINKNTYSLYRKTMQETYKTHFKEVHFAALDIEERKSKKDFLKEFINELLSAQDVGNLCHAAIQSEDDVLLNLTEEQRALVDYLAAMPRIKVD